MKDEILAGIRNAMERGQSLEVATQSFINAGYNPQEVREAARSLSGGISDIIFPQSSNEETGKSEEPKKQMLPKPTYPPQELKTNGKGNKILIFGLIIILSLIFLGAVGYLVYSFLLQ